MDTITQVKTEILNPIILLLFAGAIGYFLYGVFVFMRNQDNEEAQKTGRNHMLWGILGIFFMVAVYGILGLISRTLGIPPPTY